MSGKNCEKKKKENNSKTQIKKFNRVKKEKGFLCFIAFNENEKQSKKNLRNIITKDQYMVLREVVINNLSNNLCMVSKKSKHQEDLEKTHAARLKKLSKGKLNKKHLVKIFSIVKILAKLALKHHDLC